MSELASRDLHVRVLSVPSNQIFFLHKQPFRESILPRWKPLASPAEEEERVESTPLGFSPNSLSTLGFAFSCSDLLVWCCWYFNWWRISVQVEYSNLWFSEEIPQLQFKLGTLSSFSLKSSEVARQNKFSPQSSTSRFKSLHSLGSAILWEQYNGSKLEFQTPNKFDFGCAIYIYSLIWLRLFCYWVFLFLVI